MSKDLESVMTAYGRVGHAPTQQHHLQPTCKEECLEAAEGNHSLCEECGPGFCPGHFADLDFGDQEIEKICRAWLEAQCFEQLRPQRPQRRWYGAGTALCLFGNLGAEPAVEAFRRNVVQVLGAELFLVSTEAREALELSGFEPNWRRAVLDVNSEDPQRHLDQFPGWREVFEIEGNFAGGIFFPGSGWFQVRSLRRCKELIDEEEHLRGYRYRHVVLSRFDNMWLEPHPPLPDGQGCWIPWYRGGNDWGGFNDHHAFCDRRSAEVYMTGRYDSITDTVAQLELRDWYESCGKFTYPESLNVEKHIRYTLEKAGVPVFRFHGGPFRSCGRTKGAPGPGKGCVLEEELGVPAKSSGAQLTDALERLRLLTTAAEPRQLPPVVNRADRARYEHHPVFHDFQNRLWPVTEEFLFDWTGLRWPRSICRRQATGPRRSDHWMAELVNWKWLCQVNVAHLKSGLQLACPPLPMVDSSYFLAIVVGEAVLNSEAQEEPRPFVMGTAGAMLGHWAARAGKLSQRRADAALGPPQIFVAEDGDEWFCSLLWQVFLDDLQSPSLHCGPPSLASLSQWLEDQAHVDLLLLTFSDLILAWLRGFAALLRERVEALAVVDLSVEEKGQLLELLDGWVLVHDSTCPNSCFVQTSYGPVEVRRGTIVARSSGKGNQASESSAPASAESTSGELSEELVLRALRNAEQTMGSAGRYEAGKLDEGRKVVVKVFKDVPGADAQKIKQRHLLAEAPNPKILHPAPP
ncbi:unnamed protein product [Symbiodinium sp. CCMP2592]|nr:unnamed protein product [Symbiodinium sp. CCMP2592]